MRRRVLIAAMLVFAAQSASAGTLERAKETGLFRIGYRADARPYSYQDKQGRPVSSSICAGKWPQPSAPG
jgi:polar amino acid transport system substrate-binding protein/glutamate/aspartate transport system substrate-binding protein